MRFCGGIQYSGFSNGVRYVGNRSIGLGFVLGRRGQLSRRSSIQVDEISCIRDHPRSLLSELQVMIPKVERNGVCI